MKIYSWILVATLFVFSCTLDDFELITEEELPFEPTEVEVSESHLSLSMLNQEFEVDFEGGYGRSKPHPFLNDAVVVSISAEPLQCDGTGMNGAILPTFGAFFYIKNEKNGEPSTVAPHYSIVTGLLVDGKRKVFLAHPYNIDVDTSCHSIPVPNLTITKFTQDFISGVIEGNFIYFLGEDAPLDSYCDEQNLVPIKISFSIPIENC